MIPIRNVAELGLGASATEWQHSENSTNAPKQNDPGFIRFSLNPNLPFRRIYCYVEVNRNDNSHDYILEASVVLRKAGQEVAKLPAGNAQDPNLNRLVQSVPSFWPQAKSSTPVPNGVAVYLSKGFVGVSGGASTLVPPFEFYAVADEIALDINSVFEASTAALPKYRAWLGVFSMRGAP
jgi:hypothetical protein